MEKMKALELRTEACRLMNEALKIEGNNHLTLGIVFDYAEGKYVHSVNDRQMCEISVHTGVYPEMVSRDDFCEEFWVVYKDQIFRNLRDEFDGGLEK